MNPPLEPLTSAAENQNSGFVQFEPGLNKNAISLCMQDQEYIANIKEVQVYLDKVKKIVRLGCSQEVLNVAVSSMSSVVGILSVMSSKPKPHASL
ncbi:pyrophosphate--fructose 6-phosphate 1-phosphotransferase subunit alpha-like [Actinidia eriantha]|uniref:pyrophosphate--fructose 6-phosphate 1-phosphotransferase subunit alpha-like n=1 Tax=Actinidia eriantha TaxID=165200 RepID=UPI0025855DF9|nr:pyrophosphate--fructose 6-phosphate 1-phosphotransferase subunit alpha-like [Actinidia eriantha]